ncbi:MAG: hypothetical protein QXJ59_11550, partial [Thermofilaceae archaeon]
ELWLSQKPAWTEPDANNAAYAREKQKLLKEHRGEYAVFARGQLIGVHAPLNEVIAALRKLEERLRHALVAKRGVAHREWARAAARHRVAGRESISQRGVVASYPRQLLQALVSTTCCFYPLHHSLVKAACLRPRERFAYAASARFRLAPAVSSRLRPQRITV